MNTIQSIAAKINAFAAQFLITEEAVEVTSYQQMGPNVRVFFKLNRTIGKTPEQIAKMTQKVRMLDELIPDPFGKDGGDDGDVDPDLKPVTSFAVTLPDTVEVDSTVNATVNILPADATDKTYTVTANPTGIVEILNGGALIKGVVAGQTLLTYKANGGTVAPVTKTLEVTAKPVVKPDPTDVLADLVSADFTGTNAKVGNKFTVTAEVSPELANQEVTVSILNPEMVIKEGEEYICIAAGTCVIEVASVEKPSIKDTLNLVITNPNASAYIDAKVTFKDTFGENPDTDLVEFVNVNETANLIIHADGVVEPMLIDIETDSDDTVVLEPIVKRHILTPGVDLTIPVKATSASENGSFNILVKEAYTNAIKAVSRSIRVMDPAVVPATVTVGTVPPMIPANQEFGLSADLDVDNYTTRSVVWSASSDKFVITKQSFNELSVMVNTGDSTVGDKVTITCTVDGIVGTSTEIEIISM